MKRNSFRFFSANFLLRHGKHFFLLSSCFYLQTVELKANTKVCMYIYPLRHVELWRFMWKILFSTAIKTLRIFFLKVIFFFSFSNPTYYPINFVYEHTHNRHTKQKGKNLTCLKLLCWIFNESQPFEKENGNEVRQNKLNEL